MAMRAGPVAWRGGPVAEEDGGDGGAEGSSADEEEEEDGEEEEEEEEEEDEEDEEEEEGVQLVAGDCGPPPRARVSGVPAAAGAGAAVERANTSTCPVCMDPWTSQGPHRISCIPCGHVYGRSCLERWLTQHGNRSAKCPQCAKRFKQKDVINLYAQEVAIPNSEVEKEISYLREEIGSLKKKVVRHDKMFEEITKRQSDGGSSKRQKVAEHSYEVANLEPPTPATINFILQNELPVDGARVMTIDASNKIILVSGRATAIGAEYVLTKINMLSNHEERKIHLPPDTKAVRDMCILPGGSAIFTSLGSRLSLFRLLVGHVE
ncbi:uncharacterized protein [Miscanthus floridulus]|uniref:uncharacterized protein isoform X2 n=1 Tax=Miscanthus floridulus TaxID=154761 RepID=UPI003457E3BD